MVYFVVLNCLDDSFSSSTLGWMSVARHNSRLSKLHYPATLKTSWVLSVFFCFEMPFLELCNGHFQHHFAHTTLHWNCPQNKHWQYPWYLACQKVLLNHLPGIITHSVWKTKRSAFHHLQSATWCFCLSVLNRYLPKSSSWCPELKDKRESCLIIILRLFHVKHQWTSSS